MSHELVPGFRILTEEEKHRLLSEFGITTDNLPKILEIDPVAKALKAKRGDILEITRKSPTAGTTKYYRIFVGKVVVPDVEEGSEEEVEEEPLIDSEGSEDE